MRPLAQWQLLETSQLHRLRLKGLSSLNAALLPTPYARLQGREAQRAGDCGGAR